MAFGTACSTKNLDCTIGVVEAEMNCPRYCRIADMVVDQGSGELYNRRA